MEKCAGQRIAPSNVHTGEVTGSIPVPPTPRSPGAPQWIVDFGHPSVQESETTNAKDSSRDKVKHSHINESADNLGDSPDGTGGR
jgi:hypothetical protein